MTKGNENKIKELQIKINKLKKNNGNIIKELNTVRKEKDKVISENKDLRVKNNNELDYLYNKVNSLIKELENKNAINKTLTKQVDILNNNLLLSKYKNKNLRKRLQSLTEHLDTYSKKVVDKELDSLHLTVSQLSNKLSIQDRTIRSLNKKIFDLENTDIINENEDNQEILQIGSLVEKDGIYKFYNFNKEEYNVKVTDIKYPNRKIICSVVTEDDNVVKINEYYPDVNNRDHFLAKYGIINREKFTKVKNNTIKIKTNKFPQNIFDFEKILFCGVKPSTHFVERLKRLNLDVYWFDSYNDGYSDLERLLTKVDYVINITGSSRHYVDTIVRKSDKYLRGNLVYKKEYKLTYSNIVEILEKLLV